MSCTEFDTLFSSNTSFQQESRSSFDTILASHSYISYRNRGSSQSSNIFHSLHKYYNIEILRSNHTLLFWCSKLLKDDDTFIACMSITASILACIQSVLFFYNGYSEDTVVIYLRFIHILLSICTCIWCVRRYNMVLNIGILKYSYTESDNIVSSGLWKGMSCEIVVNMLGPWPYMNATFVVNMLDFEVEVSMESIFTFLSLMRLYMIARLLQHHSNYIQPRAEHILKMHGAKASSLFAIKCYMKSSPFLSITFLFSLMSCIFGMCMMLCERDSRIYSDEYAYRYNIDKYQDSALETFYDNMWLVIVTSTGVGYGDLVPATHLGKIVAIVTCISCSVYIGLLVSAVNNLLAHKPNQSVAYSLLKKQKIVKEMNKEYRKFVGLAMMYIISKDERCIRSMRKCLRGIYIKIGEAGDVPESDICYAKRLIDQTSDLACFTKSLNSIQVIPSSIQISRSISIFRDLISAYGGTEISNLQPRRELRFSQLTSYPVKIVEIREDINEFTFMSEESDSSSQIYSISVEN